MSVIVNVLVIGIAIVSPIADVVLIVSVVDIDRCCYCYLICD